MSDLDFIAGQILDKLAECIFAGPVIGKIAATATSGQVVVVPQALVGTLVDGRRVRVREGLEIGDTSTDVKARLVLLTPAYPRVGNFLPVTDGMVVTWISPPAHLSPTAVIHDDWAPNVDVDRNGNRVAVLGSVAEYGELKDDAASFASGANGEAAAVLLEPVCDYSNKLGRTRLCTIRSTWTLRVNIRTFGSTGDRRTKARDVFDAINASLIGRTAGSWEIWGNAWKLAKNAPGGVASHELTFTTNHVSESYPDQPAATAGESDFTELHVDLVVNEDGSGKEFHVIEDIDLT